MHFALVQSLEQSGLKLPFFKEIIGHLALQIFFQQKGKHLRMGHGVNVFHPIFMQE
jgi:hypothetical protein